MDCEFSMPNQCQSRRKAMPIISRAYSQKRSKRPCAAFPWRHTPATLYNPRAFSAIEPENPQC